MLESGWIFLGRIAFLWTLVVVAASVWWDPRNDDLALIIAGVLGVALWGIWSFGTLQVEVVDGGVAFEFSSPVLLVVGILLALPNVFVTFTGPLEAIGRVHDADPEEF